MYHGLCRDYSKTNYRGCLIHLHYKPLTGCPSLASAQVCSGLLICSSYTTQRNKEPEKAPLIARNPKIVTTILTTMLTDTETMIREDETSDESFWVLDRSKAPCTPPSIFTKLSRPPRCSHSWPIHGNVLWHKFGWYPLHIIFWYTRRSWSPSYLCPKW